MAIGADTLLGLLDTTELQHGEATRLIGGYALSHSLLRGDLDVGLHLLVETLLGPLTMEQPAENRGKPVKECHAPSSTLVIANAIRSHRRRCSSSCLRPAGVNR